MKYAIFLLVFFLAASAAIAQTLTGKVIRVADGDTITVLEAGKKQVKIRLYGIDAPEKKQAFGQRSRQTLAALVAGKDVNVDITGKDRYKRTIGIIFVDGVNANREMIEAGMAWVYDRYCKKAFCREWKELEQDARMARLGLWRDALPVPPWEWRKDRRHKK